MPDNIAWQSLSWIRVEINENENLQNPGANENERITLEKKYKSALNETANWAKSLFTTYYYYVQVTVNW